ncbi:MAG: hypothetical protein H0X17_07635 [Deltaproteobacteria bacterium]|nr:hypothetical protein [Deltaproteobacteria bacterium]
MPSTASVIRGQAYQRRATLEVAGETLTWRAQRGLQPVPENIVTTVHDVRDAHWIAQRWSVPGAVLAGVGVVWTFTQGVVPGALAFVIGLLLVVWRQLHPREYLILDVGDRRLVMQVELPSSDLARDLVSRIARALASGEPPSSPPALP